MKQKLLQRPPVLKSGIYRSLGLKKFMGRLSLVILFGLMSIKGFAQLPIQDFESGIPTTWFQPPAVGGTTAWATSTDGYMSTGAAFIDPTTENIGSGNTARYYLVTPSITVPANGQLRFFTKQSSLTDHGNIYEIRLSTANPLDPSGFTTLLTSWTETQLNTSNPLVYEEKVVNMPTNIAPGINIYVAFVLVNNQPGATPDADTWFIDNVSLQTAQPCDNVLADNFSVTSNAPTSASFSWTHPTATQFEIQVVPTGEAPAANGTATGNTYTANNLTPGTAYQVYIKALCPQNSSAWAGPFAFSTPAIGTSCETPIVIPVTNTPYVYASNLDLFQNPAVTYTTQGSNCLPSNITDNYLNGDKAFFSYTPTQNGVINIKQLALPYSQGSGCFGNAYTGVFVYEDCASVGVNCLAGLNTTTADVPKYISNLSVEAGHNYIIVISSLFDSGTSICFNFELNFSTCPTPNVITYKNLLQNSVTFSWNNPLAIAASWEYAVVPSGSPAPATGTSTNTNTDNLINTGLTAGTAYDFYVRSVCGGVPGSWSVPYKFTTQCTPFSTPYIEPFDGATETTPTACWTVLDINGDDLTWRHSWENFMISTGNNQGNNNDMVVSPNIDLGTTPKRLRFKYQTSGGVARFSVVLSTTGIGAGNFTTVIMPTISQDTDYEVVEKIVNIPTNITGNVNIAWYVDPGADETTYSLILDDIVVEDKPACPDPVALSAGTITTDTANLTWETGDVEGQWQIVVQPKDTGVPTGAGILISDNTYAATNLTHATQYEYYVRAYCSSTQQSNWVGPYYFTTLCSVFDVPFYESFNDNDPNTHKSCWTTNDANEDGTAWQIAATQASIQGNRFWGTPSYDDWLISPAINVTGTKAIKFDYKAAFSIFYPNPRFGVEVLMSTTDTNPESFSVVMPLMNFTNIEYLEKSVYITANGPVYIAFRVPPTFSTAEGTSILNIDNVRIEEAPACPNPSELTAFEIAKNTAKLSWSKGYQETQWEIKVQPAGTGVPTTAGELTTNNTAYPAASLLPNTTYEYYLRAYCSATEQSAWVGPFTFITLCEAFTAPFTETFNTDSSSEACWRVLNGNSDSFAWNMNTTIDTYEGNQAAGMFTGSNGANNDWLISPTITVTAGQRLRYYYRVNNSNFHEDLDVRLSTTGIDTAAFTTLLYSADFYDDAPLNNVEWKEKVINIPAGVTGDINIAWHIPTKDPHWEGYRGQILLIDKVIIEDIPACPIPSNLSVSEIADTTTKLSWDANGTETAWDVYVQPAELAAPVGDGDDQYRHSVSTNPYTIEGLIPAQKYEYYVRAACGDTDSEWIGPLEFTTMCSFENLCDYTITLNSAFNGGVGGGINVMQNGVLLQTMEFPTSAWNETPEPIDYPLLLCTGVEFSLFWDSVGTAPGQYPGSTVTVKDSEGNIVWTGDLGDITPRTTIFKTVSICGAISCPQPTDLAVSGTSVLSWTAGGTETQWEVAVQPVANNTLPQSGTVVTTNSYTPQGSDFANLQSGSYEFFVRALCGSGDTSFWSGPYRFVRNDDASKAITVPVNAGDVCEQSATMASFMGATVSAEPMSCTGANAGDVWFEFVAASKVHIVELGNFSAKHQYEAGNSADVTEPKITLTLYKVVGTTLQEMACTYNNVIVAAYSTELEVGATYKVRLTLSDTKPNLSTFDVCVKTPLDACKLDIVNGGFESPRAGAGGLGNFYSQNIVPGWRNNLLESDAPSLYETLYIQNGLGVDGFTTYEGGQMIQLMSPDTEQPLPDPNDLVNIKGMFQDLDSSEITKFAYSFAHLSRAQDNSVQLYAGPPTGPFVLLEEHVGLMTWSHYEGTYNVPAGQNVTRFIFRSKDNAIGNMLDAVSIIAKNEIITTAHTLSCTELSTTLEADGVGVWSADENNPADVVITTPGSITTTVTDFTKSGEYKFYWKTRYCEFSVVVTKEAVDETPAVVTPVEYCLDTTAAQLTAPATDGYTLAWYTQATGGTAETTAPTPATSNVGTTSYYVAYVNADGCEGVRAQIDVIVTDKIVPIVAFTYETSYCEGSENALPQLATDFYTGGVFSSTNGLAIDAATGEINVEASVPGSYEITYTVEGDASVCNTGGSHSFTVFIAEGLDGLITQECRENDVWLTVDPLDDSFDSATVDYVWRNEAGTTVGSNVDFNATQYFADNNSTALPLKFTVTVTSGDCSNEIEYTVTNLMCDIPRGISPNGDGFNDTLDLSGYSIKDITIFNRYGKKVYSHGANYTNNWHGQDNNNNELPDGTYFYIITKSDSTNVTGWIYINK
ncbi:hypothetical protein AMR72_03220 [Flavobacterium psychrophilum]|nr:hypothetical protein AMR72_03220 [Flavobacterium psychrophilum]AOE51605.1 hypothetical protein ALW18_03220 [Flavobacterium psychrophilum]